MREIKFRAWDKKFKQMCTVDLLDLLTDGVEGNRPNGGGAVLENDEFELMQYTGLKDKNGKEIYEGDIFKHGTERSFVKWDKDDLQWFAQRCKKHYPTDKILNKDGHMLSGFSNYEVIGNVYENPELIEKIK